MRENDKLTCSVLDCDNHAFSRGWCRKHYSRWYRHGDTNTVLEPKRERTNPDTCTIKECYRPCHAKGWCTHHYKNWSRRGDPLITAKDLLTCSCEGCCQLRPVNNFWCDKHFEMITEGVHPESIYSQSGWGIDYHGYVQICWPKQGRQQPNRMRHHRLVMQAHMRRALLPNESVHHRDGNRQNNILENLELWCSVHGPGQRVGDLVDLAIAIITQYPDEFNERVDKLAGEARQSLYHLDDE